ncbi:MAG: hypothetical protein B6I17_00325 [Tenericutes bacterium 4572_104]|nr:MAG: hypothetical protein B6I17_00325 [Tenericutes bacterium 4572_104]
MIFPGEEFNKASVKDANINKGLLVDLFNKIDDDSINIHSMMLLKNGSRVFKASAYSFDEDTKENVYSVSKAFTSIAIGILVDKELIRLDTPVFMYNNYATFILSAIVSKVTGKSLNDFLDEYLYKIIGIEKPRWDELKGYSLGASRLYLSANDMARFGLLLLNDGMWKSHRVVSSKYLEEATKLQIKTNYDDLNLDYDKFGYGYLFWLNSFGDFRASGSYQQHIVINKEYGLVFVLKAFEERNLLSLFENYILKAAEEEYNYCDYSLRDFIRRFKINSKEIIIMENKK